MPDVHVRALSTHDEFRSAVRLQGLTWGEGYTDVVPASLLKVACEVGGVCLGAFVDGGVMVGFVFGLTGPRDGRLQHWSHMLAVEPAWRDRGVGRTLKKVQARVLRSQGVDTMLWTFDPLVARNAHLNVRRLGVKIVRYAPNMYDHTGSDVHAFGTDRFIVAWPLDQAGPTPEGPHEDAHSPVLGPDCPEALDRPRLRIAIPTDIERIHATAPAEAFAWRERSRAAFVEAFEHGFAVVGFDRTVRGGTCHYILEKDPAYE